VLRSLLTLFFAASLHVYAVNKRAFHIRKGGFPNFGFFECYETSRSYSITFLWKPIAEFKGIFQTS
jgi:hypothetical protein